jgi:tetratricopeptide (TPR) repeat protein
MTHPSVPVRPRPPARRRPTLIGSGILLLLFGVVAWYGGRQTWGHYHWRQAQRANLAHDFAKAREHLSRCLTAWPEDQTTHLYLAQTLRRAGQLDAARLALREADRLGGPATGVDLEYLLLDMQEGDLAVAPVLQQRALAGDPNESQIFEALVKGYLQEHHWPEAAQLATVWLERQPHDWQPWYLRGLALKSAQVSGGSAGLDRAREDLRHAVELKPDHADARLLLADLLDLANMPREALAHYEIYRQSRPDDPAAVVGQAGCRLAIGQLRSARDILDEWFATHQDAPAQAYFLRARVELDLDGEPERVLSWLQRTVMLAPHHDDAHHNLGLVLRRLNRNEEALQHEDQCREIRRTIERLRRVSIEIAQKKEDPDLRYQAGVLQMRLGSEERALLWWRSALQDDPAHKATHQALADHYERTGQRRQAAEHRALAEGKTPPAANKPEFSRRR